MNYVNIFKDSETLAAERRATEAARCEIRATCPGCNTDVPAHYIRENGTECEYCETEEPPL